MTVIDTTLLVDLQRGASNPRRRAAEEWLGANPDEPLAVPAVVLGEFAEGFDDPDHPVLMALRTRHPILSVDEVVASRYGELSRRLRAAVEGIGANDTWIAATALVHEAPLLTRNGGHFRRVEGLVVVAYGSG